MNFSCDTDVSEVSASVFIRMEKGRNGCIPVLQKPKMSSAGYAALYQKRSAIFCSVLF